MNVEQVTLDRKYHDAVVHWRKHWMPDYDVLLENWDKYFPKDEQFCLCAKMECGTPTTIKVGEHAGKPKRLKPDDAGE